MSSTTSTPRKVRQPRVLTQHIDGEAKAKLQQVAAEGRIAELIRKDASHYLLRMRCEDWLRAVEGATQPLGPRLLPKTVKNIAAWRALTPAQQADRKARAIATARAEAAAAKAQRQAKKNARPNQEG